VYVRIAFRHESEAEVVNPSDHAPTDAIRTALATLAAYTTTPATGYAAVWEGWGGAAEAPQAARVEIPLPGAVRRVRYGEQAPMHRDQD